MVPPVVTPTEAQPSEDTTNDSSDVEGELTIIAPSDELMIDPDVVSRKVKKDDKKEKVEDEDECEEDE